MDVGGSSDDTIAAVATPAGGGAVAVLRVSGPQAVAVVDKATGDACGQLPDRRVSLTKVVDRNGAPIDDVLLTVFRAPRSYTGEDVVELSCHGGLLITRLVLERLLECGARSAEPGEFTRRAFLNGKMDLTQAEAVMDLISARTGMALRAARVQMEGRLGAKSEALRAELLDLVAELEAYIDFPDEDITPDVGKGMAGRMEAIASRLDALAATADHGRMLREGVRTVIFGAPNVGKSSLLNRLAGHDRAIVHARAGTTRDTIEECVEIGGVALLLTDTAGVRDAGGDVERQGVERSRRALETADLVIEVVDGSTPPGPRLGDDDLAGRPHVLVRNKCDLGFYDGWHGTDGAAVSCLTGEGFDALAQRVLAALEFGPDDWGADAVAVNARHKACLRAASESAGRARELLESGDAPEFVAIELREALDQVAAIAGRVDIEEILGGIFGKFCIGK